jgi:hypothetical protein
VADALSLQHAHTAQQLSLQPHSVLLALKTTVLRPPAPLIAARGCCSCAGRGRDANPLAHVLQAIDEPLECKQYNTWNVIVPEGQFLTRVRTFPCFLVSCLALTCCQL